LRARYTGEIASGFGVGVFEDVKRLVKDLVLVNTWPKFVREMQVKRTRSVDSEGSGVMDDSGKTVVSRLTRFVRSLV